jgi:hypothetical protein
MPAHTGRGRSPLEHWAVPRRGMNRVDREGTLGRDVWRWQNENGLTDGNEERSPPPPPSWWCCVRYSCTYDYVKIGMIHVHLMGEYGSDVGGVVLCGPNEK